jgi:tetratricopeptide (TPR) repeat protein
MEKTMSAAVYQLGERLAQAQADRAGTLLDLAARHQERGNHVGAVSVALDAVEAFAAEPDRRADALCAIARSLLAAEAWDLAGHVMARAIQDAVTAMDPIREAHAREIQGLMLFRRNQFQAARHEFRIAGLRYRMAQDTLAMKRAAKNIANTYRHQGMAATTTARYQHAEVNFKQAMRVYRIALATGEFAADDASIAAAAADCESRRGNYGLARIQVDRALALLPRVDDLAIVAEVHLAECRLLRTTGDLRAAEWAGERACVAARNLRDDTLSHALLALASVNDAQGRFERATDTECRARELMLERHRRLTDLREELNALWRRDTAAPIAVACNAA